MMRNIAIGLAAATIAIGGSTLSASALYGQESGIRKGSMSGSVKSQRFGPRTYGFYDEERGRGLTPLQRERLRGRCANATPSSPRSNVSVSGGSCANASPTSPRSNASVSSGSFAPATSSSLRSNASVSIVTAPTAVAEWEIATGGSTLAVDWLSCHCTGEPFYIQ